MGQPSSLDKKVITVPGVNKDITITRRHLLIGAVGIGVLAAAGAGAKLVSEKLSDDKEISILSVPNSALTTSNDLTEVESSDHVYLSTIAHMDYGTLVFANDPSYAACLMPSEVASPLTRIGILNLESGYYSSVIDEAQGSGEGFEIYDVRMNGNGLVWIEANILANKWRVYTAKVYGFDVSDIQLVDQGGAGWETPSIAAAGNYAFWQVLPLADGEYSSEKSLLKKAAFGSAEATQVYASTGRMSTPIYALEDKVVITPRADTGTVHYQLTLIDAATDAVLDTLVLPASMKPLEAGYGQNGFMFCFDAIYSYGDGISNLGSYTPAEKVTGSDYSNHPWFNFVRTPTAPPAWCGNCFCVKSTSAVCGILLDSLEYFVLEVPSGAGDYGDYLASTGMGNAIVTFCNVDSTPVDGDAVHECTVRVWKVY